MIKGPNFANGTLSALSTDFKIKFVFARVAYHAPQAERAIGTIKLWIQKHMLDGKTRTYVSILPTLVRNFNNMPNATTHLTPSDVVKNASTHEDVSASIEAAAFQRFKPVKHKLEVGDSVRILAPRNVFSKSTDPYWSKDVYKVTKVIMPKANYAHPRYELDDGVIYPANEVLPADETQTSGRPTTRSSMENTHIAPKRKRIS